MADWIMSKSVAKPRRPAILLITVAGFHGDKRELQKATKACKAAVTFFLLSPFLPAHCTCHHDSCLLTFSRSSSPSVQPRFKGHRFNSVHTNSKEPESALVDKVVPWDLPAPRQCRIPS